MMFAQRWIAGGLACVTLAGCSSYSVRNDEDTMVDAGVALDTATQIQVEEELNAQLTAALPLHVRWSTSALGGERVRMVQLTDSEILVVTGRWHLWSIDRKTGVSNWVYQLRYPLARQGIERRMVPFGISEEFLYVLYDGDLLGAIWRSSGHARWLRKITEFTPGTFLAGNNYYCYLGALDKNRVYAIRESDQGIAWDYATTDAVVAAPIEMQGTVVYFADLFGATYGLDASKGDLLWRHQAARGSRADLSARGGKLFVGSLDHALYGLDRTSGKPEWVFETGGPIEAPAQTGGDTVYVRAIDPPDRFGVKGEPTLFAIDEATGEEKWRLRRGVRLLFRGKEFAYVLREGGVMVVVENHTGRVRKPSPEFDGYPLQSTFPWMMTNEDDDVLYLITGDGFMFALQETDPSPYK
jgi:outer membrane protein assembly factor BamB